jgi:predicted small lipoprotein YifL
MAIERSLIRVCGVLLAVLMVSACGQKGPLRMPDPKSEAAPVTTPAAPNEAQDPSTLEARRRNPHE